MKFGKHLAESVLLEWSNEYLNYKALKQKAKGDRRLVENAQRAEFLFLFERELERVDAFYSRRYVAIERRIELVRRGMEAEQVNLLSGELSEMRLFLFSSSLSDFQPSAECPEGSILTEGGGTGETLPSIDRDSVLLEHVEECRIWIRKLQQYASLNLEGFRKLLKKYDKKHEQRTNLLGTYFGTVIIGHQFASSHGKLNGKLKYLDECALQLLERITGGKEDSGLRALNEIRKVWNDIYALQVQAILEEDDSKALLELSTSLALVELCPEGGVSRGDDGQERVQRGQEQHPEQIRSIVTQDGPDMHSPSLAAAGSSCSIGALQHPPSSHNLSSHLLSVEGEPFSLSRQVKSSERLPERTLLLLQREHALLLRHLLDGVCHHQSLRCLELLLDSGLDIIHVERWMNISLVHKVLASLPQEVAREGQVIDSERSLRAAEMVRMLAKKGAILSWRDARGRTAAHHAILSGSLACLRALLEQANLNPNAFDHDGCSPLFLALQSGLVELVAALLDHADRKRGQSYAVLANDTPSTQPLLLASKLGHYELLAHLVIHRRFDLNIADGDGETALHYCAKRDYVRCLLLLLEHGADAERREKYSGWTALFMAAAAGNLACTEALLHHGARTDAVDNEGWTAFEHAIFRGHFVLARIIKPPSMASSYENIASSMLAYSDSDLSTNVSSKMPIQEDSASTSGSSEASGPLKRPSSASLPLPLISSSTSSSSPSSSSTSTTSTSNVHLEEETTARVYGHYFLDASKVILLTLGHRSGPHATRPIVELLDRQVTGPLDLHLRIWPSKSALGEAVMVEVPVRGEPETISFMLENKGQCYASTLDEIRLDLVRPAADGTFEPVGRGAIMLREFLEEDGRPRHCASAPFVISIFDRHRLEPMALVSLQVLIATPFIHQSHSPLPNHHGHVYWRSVHTKVIGHRGMGANSGLSHPQIGENTLLSFVMAASLGAEYVEFDVQLTKDLVPVLYHDLIVSETGLDVGISSLSLQQFLALRKSAKERYQPARSPLPSSFADDTLLIGTQQSRPLSLRHFETLAQAKGIIEMPFATLSEVLQKVPPSIGFNIELKYPMLDEISQYGLQHVHEMNEYCDRILKVVFEQARDRAIIFSSFCPDICLLLSLKQPTYPVFFLTGAGSSFMPSEPRANSLQQAIRFAKSARLLGIVAESTPLLEAPRLISTVREHGLLLFTYGARNNDLASVHLQKRCGVNAVIVDSVARIHRGLANFVAGGEQERKRVDERDQRS